MLDGITYEDQRRQIEACLPPDQVVFSITQTAKTLNRSNRWVREKIANGKLKAVRLDGDHFITRPTMVTVLMEGI